MGLFGFGKKKENNQEAVQKPAEPVLPPIEDEQQETPEEKKGLFARLFKGLSKTRNNVAGKVDDLVEATEEIDDDIYDEFILKINEFGEIADFRVEYDDWEEANTYMVVFRDYPYYYAQEFDFDLDGDLQKAKDSISFWLNAVEERKAKLAEIVQFNKIIDVTEVEEWFLTHNHGDDMTFVDRFIADTGVEMDILEQTGFLHYLPKTHIYTNGTDFVKADHFLIKELDGEWHVVEPISIDEYKAR